MKRGRPAGSLNPATEARRKRARLLRKWGLTWARIGEDLGLTRQGASQLVKRGTKK